MPGEIYYVASVNSRIVVFQACQLLQWERFMDIVDGCITQFNTLFLLLLMLVLSYQVTFISILAVRY